MGSSEAICWLLIAHTVADFYLQDDRMARIKGHDKEACVKHCLRYAGCMLVPAMVVVLTIGWCRAIVILLVLAGSHAIIDLLIRPFAARRMGEGIRLFVIDQGLHVTCIVVAGLLATPSAMVDDLWSPVRLQVLAWALCFALCVKPSSIAVRELISDMRGVPSPGGNVSSEADAEKTLSAGSIIGVLERLIVSTLTSLGQFGAIAFVLTAKSIARFKRFETDEDFAEIYLVGTLSSVAFAMLSTLLIRFVLGVA